jgi:8-oxo-dGTP pyrophosphatase MutT (NUDIX family)
MVTKPKDAATVVLLRNRPEPEKGIEVLMVLRNPKSDFVPGSYVFPGGGLEKEDCLPGMESLCSGIDREGAATILKNCSMPQQAYGLWATAVRETFEEVGLLMACRKDGSIVSISADKELKLFRTYRRMLREKRITFYEILKKEELFLAADRLHYFSHWITPEASPIRYDTRFFVAEAPFDQRACHDGVELTNHVWVTPSDALAGFKTETFNMVLPTVMTLEEMSRFDTAADVIRCIKKKDIKTNCIRLEIDEKKGITVYAPDGRIFRHIPPTVQ